MGSRIGWLKKKVGWSYEFETPYIQVLDQMRDLDISVRLTTRKIDTGEIVQDVCVGDDVLVNNGRATIIDLLGKVAGVTGIEFGAISTASTADTQTTSALAGEVGRRQITLYSRATQTGTWEIFFESAYPTGSVSIVEVGLFGNGATQTSGSGTLFFKKAISPAVTKDNTLTLTLQYVVNFP